VVFSWVGISSVFTDVLSLQYLVGERKEKHRGWPARRKDMGRDERKSLPRVLICGGAA